MKHNATEDLKRLSSALDIIQKDLRARMKEGGVPKPSEHESSRTTASLYLLLATARGWEQGCHTMTCELLSARFGPLSDEIHARIRGTPEDDPGNIARRLLKAESLEQFLDPTF